MSSRVDPATFEHTFGAPQERANCASCQLRTTSRARTCGSGRACGVRCPAVMRAWASTADVLLGCARVGQLPILIDSHTVTISRLMEIVRIRVCKRGGRCVQVSAHCAAGASGDAGPDAVFVQHDMLRDLRLALRYIATAHCGSQRLSRAHAEIFLGVAVALLSNLLMRPVDPKHHIKSSGEIGSKPAST